ncbi:TetR/AcrR family transcriptional regulator [Maribacter arenosus]|uniref:TetR/AcrR family transcriptional regulator n=1 Tax=Maribacter arenosus TaxID=1854708 RepID=A0ABR7V9P7_9FLAO|nr:TetR/AcrR family transcriptional regulator [Maribacter arenosus]MBD0850384.1 TetR/AcrR family transcriptional regulator [Maribacter arenosus]
MREKILHKATDLFLNLGFKSVTMDDLAHELGISKKTIYAHFANKTKLIEECTKHLFCAISEGIDHICSLNKNPIEELYEIKKFALLHLKDEKASTQYQLQKYYPKIYENIKDKQFFMMEGCVVSNIKKGITLGIYRENLNIDFVSRIYFAGITSLKDHELFPVTKFPRVSLMDEYLEYHLRGIVTPKGRQVLNNTINSNQE